VSSRPCEQTPQDAELPGELPEGEVDPHPAGRLSYLQSSIGLRVAALAGFAIVAGIGLGTDGWGGSTCC
jgi:hypothetical protein